MPEYEAIVRNCRVLDEPELQDIAIADGTFAAIAPHLPSAGQEWDAAGKLVTAPFVESHIHLDSAFTAGDPRWNQSGTLFEGIEIWRERKQQLSLEDVRERAIAALKQQATNGVLYVRSHADVSESSLTALKGLLSVRDEVKDWMHLQVVAFPQDGVFGSPQQVELMEEAMRLGADAVGGIPHYELTREDGVQSLDSIFNWAEQFDALVDIHCDEIDDSQARFLETVVAHTLRRDMGDRVTASHTTAFHSYNNAYAGKLMGFIRRSQLNFVANPLINITLQGRTDTYPKRRGVTRVPELRSLGANVSLGHDCISDPWYGMGTGNMLDVAHMAVHVCQMTGRDQVRDCFEMVTTNGAKTLHLGDRYGLKVGNPANFVVLNVNDAFEAIRHRDRPRYVFSRGRLLAETIPARDRFHPHLEKSAILKS
ncbi:MAG: cytosine deaminase [Cyanobacteria bacterium P01_D01_bin.123]